MAINTQEVELQLVSLTPIGWEEKAQRMVELVRAQIGLEDAVQTLVEQVATMLQVQRCFMIEFDKSGVPIPIRIEARSQDSVPSFKGMTPPWHTCPFLRKAGEKLFTWAPDTLDVLTDEADKVWHALFQKNNIRGFIASPIVHDDEILCVLVMHTQEPRQWSEEELLFAQVCAQQAALSVFQFRAAYMFKQLRRNEALLSDFFENGAVGMHWVGPDGIILKANKAELELLGYTAEEYIGHHIAEFHADDAVICDILRRLSTNEVLHSYQARLRCKDGSIKHVLISSSVYLENGEFIHARCFTRDVTEQKQVQDALKLSEARYHMLYDWEKKTREVLQSIRQSIDTNKVFPAAIEEMAKALNANRAFIIEFDGNSNKCRPVRYEYRSHDAVKPFTGIVPPWDFCPYLSVSAKNEMAWSKDTYNDKDFEGNEEWYQFSRKYTIRSIVTSPILYKDKLMNVVVFHTEDPREWTEQERFFIKVVGDQLSTLFYQEKVREELIQAAEIKSDFLSKMSHELRTPLNAIIGYAKMIEQGMAGPMTEKQAEYIHYVGSSGEHLLNLVNDLLDFSKIEAGKMTVDPEPFDILSVIADVKAMLEEMAQKKGVNLSFQIQPDIGAIEADPQRFKQILLNLISNAIKFNHVQGAVSVRLNTQDGWLVGEVQDTGIGIPKTKLPELFIKFHQIDNSASRKHEGTGLGLVLAKELLELHGGKISVESEEGVGTTFTFKLPVISKMVSETQYDNSSHY